MITDLDSLCAILEIDPRDPRLATVTQKNFPLRVPHSFVRKMQKGNINDPLLLQILPLQQELLAVPGYTQDPLEEKQFNPLPGLLHKYYGRVLLVVTGGCALHCRYCFRRHFPYEEHSLNLSDWQKIFNYIAQDTSISEVILSGGDPLLLKDKILADLLKKLAAIPHLTTLRIHSRFPLVVPQRLTSDLAEILSSTRLKSILVIHANHANELDDEVKNGLTLLRQKLIPVLNQSVLLKGINDDAQSLIHLSQRLFDAGVLPYYLHLLDKVQGVTHFAVSKEQAQDLIRKISARLPGYLVPKLVMEVPGAQGKVNCTV